MRNRRSPLLRSKTLSFFSHDADVNSSRQQFGLRSSTVFAVCKKEIQAREAA